MRKASITSHTDIKPYHILTNQPTQRRTDCTIEYWIIDLQLIRLKQHSPAPYTIAN